MTVTRLLFGFRNKKKEKKKEKKRKKKKKPNTFCPTSKVLKITCGLQKTGLF